MIPLLKEFVTEVKNFTDCEAIGIRILDENGNIPYEAHEGFAQSFYQSECPLSLKSDQGMCINVIKGDIDPSHPFYTERGSFYVNGTTRFLATVSEEEKGQTRNLCNEYGYESVALVPITLGDRILGLIHIADPRENKVPLWIVEVLERIGSQLAQAIERIGIEESLREAHDELKRTSESALRESRDQLQVLAGKLSTVQEEERRQLARELHDDLSQRLAVLAIDTGKLEKQFQADKQAGKKPLQKIREEIIKLSSDVHSLSRQLHPSIIDDLGLVDAMRSECESFSHREGILVDYTLERIPSDISKEVSLCLYRVMQESLRNIAKHTQAKQVEVILQYEDNEILLQVKDQGGGFDPLQLPKKVGLGLASMKERVRLIQGKISLRSEIGQGTTVEVRIPVAEGLT